MMEQIYDVHAACLVPGLTVAPLGLRDRERAGLWFQSCWPMVHFLAPLSLWHAVFTRKSNCHWEYRCIFALPSLFVAHEHVYHRDLAIRTSALNETVRNLVITFHFSAMYMNQNSTPLRWKRHNQMKVVKDHKGRFETKA